MTPRAPAAPALALAAALLCGAGTLAAQQKPAPARQPADTSRAAPQQPAVLGQPAAAAQQPAAAQPAVAAQQPAAVPQQPPVDPRAQLLERLRRLDARPDTTSRDSTAARDSTARDSMRVQATPAGGRPAPVLAGVEEDSIMKALGALPGFTPTEYSGKSADFAADTKRLVLTGPAKVVQAGQSMTADSTLVYNQTTQIACGYGKPVLTGAGQSNPVESEQVCYDAGKRMGVAFGAKTKFQEGATAWYVDGHKVYTSGTEDLFGRDSEFTDCDLAKPHYHFTAKELKMVRGNLLVAKDVTLSFADVPVFWLPFMVQSMQSGRRSGLLMPRFSINDVARTSTSYNRHIDNVGFFWAMNQHMGSQLALDWFANTYTGLNGSFDYDFRRQFFNGGLAMTRFWRANGSKELAFNLRNSWRPDERTNLQLNAAYASASFVREQSFDPRELNRSIDSNLAMSRQFDWGSLNVSGHRRQMLQNDRVTMTLPTLSLSFTPVSLFRRADGTPLMNWNGSGSFEANQDVNGGNLLVDPQPTTHSMDAGFNSSLNLGKLSWGQTVKYTDDRSLLRAAFQHPASSTDTTIVTEAAAPAQAHTVMTWSTQLNYQQRLFGNTQITPSLTLSGQSASLVRDSIHTAGMISAPTRMSFGVGTQVELYGFWPGVGPFSRFRHKLVPTIGYSYSPALKNVSKLQQLVFGTGANGVSETNLISLGLTQTFEGRFKESASADSTPQDTTASLDGEPRRLKKARTITLLSLSGWAATYDFTSDSLGRRIGFQAPQIVTSARSDLIPGLEFSLTHDIFRYDDPVHRTGRHFSPYLTNASTNFQLDEKSWIFRMLGLATRVLTRGTTPPVGQPDSTTTTSAVAAEDAGQTPSNSIIPGARTGTASTPAPRGSVGSWHGSFTYTLSRTRPTGLHDNTSSFYSCNPIFQSCGSLSSQMLQGTINFQPTAAWSVSWRTSYNFSQSQFADHVLTLTRDLHDWQANFDFVKTQTGNFSFVFRVNLKAQPDLKFDYSQRGGSAYQQFIR